MSTPKVTEFAGARDEAVSTDDRRITRRIEQALRRGLDLILTCIMLIILFPMMIVIAIVVKVSSPGPVLFVHDRVGLNGQTLKLLKFRTMEVGTDAAVMSDPQQRKVYEESGFKLQPDDPRITRAGRWLRKSSMDELPQLFNVLVGQMSLVGVRPVRDPELELRPPYDQMLYMSMRPGMTGLWQVEGRSSIEDQDRLALDRIYLEQWSVWRDLVLLARTPVAVLRVNHTR